jgi:SnoaL-like polyketide cyclase
VPIRDDESFEFVRDDLTTGLAGVFEPLDDSDETFGVREQLESQEVIANAAVAAVPWVYRCRHVGEFQGLFPTGRELRIDGVTIVDRSGGEPLFYRYIDWAGVIAQLGLTVSPRIPVTEAEYLAGTADPTT